MDEKLFGATAAVQWLEKGLGNKDAAQRAIVRECQSGRLIAVARRQIVRQLVDYEHRERFRMVALTEAQRSYFTRLENYESHNENCDIPAVFWRDAFDEDGTPLLDDWGGAVTTQVDWTHGNFKLVRIHRTPVEGWVSDRGDKSEIDLVGVRFLADGVKAIIPPKIEKRKPRLPEAMLLRWWNQLSEHQRSNLSQPATKALCEKDHPNHWITKRMIPGLKDDWGPRGRKALRHPAR